MRCLVSVLLFARSVSGFCQCSVDETVLGVHDGSLAVLSCFFFYAPCCIVAVSHDFFCVGELCHKLLDLMVVLQQFDGEVACGVFLSDVEFLLQVFLNTGYSVLYFVSVVDVYVSVFRVVALFSLVVLYDGAEEIVKSSSVSEHGRYDGHTE